MLGKSSQALAGAILLTRDSPGRFFANHLLKLLLSQIVLRYDIKPNANPRPQNPVSGSNLFFQPFPSLNFLPSPTRGILLPFGRLRPAWVGKANDKLALVLSIIPL